MSKSNKKVISRSQEMRNVYFNLWEKDNEGFETFDSYYDNKMKKVIIFLRKKLQ